MRHAEAFDEAVRRGYIRQVEENYLLWTLGSESLLAFMLGKLFCDDITAYSPRKRKVVWQRGQGIFPATELQRIFRMKSLKRLRLKREFASPPASYQLIEELFHNEENEKYTAH